METPQLLVVMPALNEERSIGHVVTTLANHGYTTCVVDDGSTDDTRNVAADAGAKVLRLPVNLGVGGALRCGFRYARDNGYDMVVQCDADGQHRPDHIPLLLAQMEATGCDMVVGSRFAGAGSYELGASRRFAMNILGRVVGRSRGGKLSDVTSGFRAIRQPLLDFFADEYPVEYLGDTVEALVDARRAGFSVTETAVEMSHRETGSPSASSVASTWYVARVLGAILLQEGRSAPQPTSPNRDAKDL